MINRFVPDAVKPGEDVTDCDEEEETADEAGCCEIFTILTIFGDAATTLDELETSEEDGTELAELFMMRNFLFTECVVAVAEITDG